jgi:hypothetical protein
MDEVHFVSKGKVILACSHSSDVARRRGLSSVGEELLLVANENFAETYSVSCLCSLDLTEPVYLNGTAV